MYLKSDAHHSHMGKITCLEVQQFNINNCNIESLYCTTPTVYSTIALELMVVVIAPLVQQPETT